MWKMCVYKSLIFGSLRWFGIILGYENITSSSWKNGKTNRTTIPVSQGRRMHSYQFRIHTFGQANGAILHLWVQQILNRWKHPVVNHPLCSGTLLSLHRVMLLKEFRCWGSKKQQSEAIELPADEKLACRHAAKKRQTSIFAQTECREPMTGRLVGLEWLQHCSFQDDIQETTQINIYTMLNDCFLLEQLANLQWGNLSMGQVALHEPGKSVIQKNTIQVTPTYHQIICPVKSLRHWSIGCKNKKWKTEANELAHFNGTTLPSLKHDR